MSSGTPTDDEAINLLSLDGGGVRGVASLVILDGIMRKIKDMYGLPEVPKPCEFFHMIAGTSTGGLIAIMLGRLRMSTKEALAEYDNCAAKIFSKDNHKSWSISEKFRATALEEAIQDLVKRRGLGESMRDPENPQKGKAFVCVMPSDNIGKTDIVRSFDGDDGAQDNWDEHVKIWEAARATTAASSFFKPQRLGGGASARTYIDAAIGVNNPVSILLPEAAKEFGAGRRFGCVISIGTGTRDVKLERSAGGLQSILKFRGVVYYVDLMKTLKNLATDAEEAHRQLESKLLPFPGTYYRFNIPDAAAQVKLHHYLKIPELKSSAEKYLSSEPVAKQVRQIAKALKTDEFDHGLTLGHLHDLDKDQLLLSSKKIRSMGATSNFFTGRQEILQKLDSFFTPRDTGGSPRREFILHGMGGVGKTEIAFKVSEALEDRFEYIFYIDGSTPATVVQSYANIAKQHDLAGALTEELCTKAMQWMERLSEEWLMIFDDCNLDDRKGHLPGRGKGNIIYTSRRTSLNQDLPIDCTYEVTPFGEADAIELLSKASGFPSASENPREKGLAEAIVRELECLPLAVEKAAAYIRDGSYSLQEYLEKLRAEKVRILSDPRPEDEEQDIKNSAVYAALELSYQAIASRRRREGRSGAGHTANFALKVLSLLTFFHHKEFPSLLMQRAADEYHAAGAPRYFPLSHLMSPYDYDLDRMVRAKEDGHWDSRDFVSGVTILRKFSLIKLSPDKKSLSMHVLVHRWARKRMEKDIALRWALVARVLLLESLDPAGRLGYLEFSRRLLPHFEVCFAVNPPLYLIRDQYRAHLLHKLGEYYRNQKRFVEAKECFSQSHRLWRIEVGADCWSAIDVAISLARLHHEMGNLSEAESAYLDAISWLSGKLAYRKAVVEAEAEKEAGEEDEPERARRLSKASVKTAMKGFAGKPSKHRSIGIRSSVLFPSRKQPSKAEGMKRPSEPNIPNDDILDRKLRRAEHMEELDNIDIADNLVHAELAMVYMDQDRYGMGKRMFLKAVGLLEQQLDKYNPDLMKLQVKARTLTHARDRESWENYMDDVLQAPQDTTALFWQSEAAFDLMIAATNSLLMSDTEDWALACRQLFSLHDAGIKSYGYCDRKILKILRYVVECLVTGGKYDNAAQMASTCLRRARSTYGELHIETIRSYVTLTSALIYQKLEFDDEGRELLQGAVEKARAGLGSAHSLTQTLERHLRELSEKVEVPVRPESELLDPEAALMESWRQSKARLESDRAVLGDQHPIIKRMELMVGDGPARTKGEMLERVRVGYGPHNSFTKRLERELEESRRAASAQNPEMNGDSERITLEPPGSNAPRVGGAGSSGEGLRQPLQLMNEMTRARHTALGSKDLRAERSRPVTEGHISLDRLIREIIENEPGDGVVTVDDRASGNSVGFWMSGALQPVLAV